MNMRTVVLLIGLLAILVIGMFVFTYLQSDPGEDTTPEQTDENPQQDGTDRSGDDRTTPPADEPASDEAEALQLTQSYRDGALHISGTLETPTPCHTITVEPVILESYPEQVVLDIQTTPGEGMCAQVLTEQSFTAVATTSAEATIVSAQVNNTNVPISVSATSTTGDTPAE